MKRKSLCSLLAILCLIAIAGCGSEQIPPDEVLVDPLTLKSDSISCPECDLYTSDFDLSNFQAKDTLDEPRRPCIGIDLQGDSLVRLIYFGLKEDQVCARTYRALGQGMYLYQTNYEDPDVGDSIRLYQFFGQGRMAAYRYDDRRRAMLGFDQRNQPIRWATDLAELEFKDSDQHLLLDFDPEEWREDFPAPTRDPNLKRLSQMARDVYEVDTDVRDDVVVQTYHARTARDTITYFHSLHGYPTSFLPCFQTY